MKQVYFRLVLAFLFSAPLAGSAQTPALKFIKNKGQWPESIDFAARTPAGRLMLSPGHFSLYLFDQQKANEAHLRLHDHINESDGTEEMDDKMDGHHVQIRFSGALALKSPVASLPSKEYYNFFLGNDTSQWASRASAFGEIVYPDLYTGIDLRISSVNQNLKYDFIVKPDAYAGQVQIEINGADQLYLDHGNVIVGTSVGYLIEKKPFTYQVINGEKCEVKSEYTLTNNTLSFRFPEGYDACYELVIDPLLIFSTFSGSTADNWGSTATPGERGTLYSSGIANNINFGGTFPATPGAFQTTYGGNYDIAILKYDSTGSQLLYASYIGGSGNETPHSLVMDEKSQDLIVLGTTSSFNFPTTTSALSTMFNGGIPLGTNVIPYPFGSDIVLSRISKEGDQLIASTYLGGSQNDGLNQPGSPLVRNYGDEMRGDVITDTLGNIYISSVTNSPDFPGVNSFSTTYRGGGSDAVVVKMDAMLTQIIWSAFVGGNNFDASHTIKFDSAFAIYLGGGTSSADFPTTTNSYQSLIAGGVDGWIMKISSEGDSIAYSTFTGTSDFDQVYFIDLDRNGDVYTYGQTNGNFPVTPGVYSNANSGQFVQKFNGELNTLIFSTRFGSGIGIPNISPTAFLVNDCNNLYMSGWGGLINSGLGYWNSNTSGMPVTNDALQKTTSGSDFYFIVLTADASELLYATYLGGNISRTHVDGGTSRFDKSGIVYHAVCSGCRSLSATGLPSSDFPTTDEAWSRTNNSANCNNAAFKFDLSSLRARLQTNSVAFDAPGLDVLCYPDTIRFQNFSTGGEFYEWDLGDGTKLVKTDTTSFLHQYQNEGTYLVKLRAVDLNTCVGVDSAFKTVRVFRNLLKAQEDDVICYGTSYQLTGNGGVGYQWSTEDGPLNTTLVKPEESIRYFVVITDSNGCFNKDTVDIEVVPFIDVQFDYKLVPDCISRSQVYVVNKTEQKADENYLIDFGDGNTTDLPEAIHAYNQDGAYTLKVTGIKEFCVYEKQVTLPIYTILAPNVITPESTPGQNDRFVIQYGAGGKTPADAGLTVGLTIHNRWGGKVFESANYQYDWSAKDLDAGIYYYTVTIGDQALCKSWLHVVK
ncbi:MAG: gliding motility-associated C-terminal domain-containing protein [Cyclobacteriaceae bacterium]|nr:gliding motility-associated C-terminal domain-containing protein [Cyclobacteriaceae bacterium]UYN85712.1 MAG: gliding motility-associated C-terminal domain-containing protein [Cyclobacteriaceae bacterium]